jgi:RHS repeat-associated protein
MSPGIVAESDLSGNLQSEYVFFDGERVARKDFPGNAVSYYFSDHLKTASVITDAVGTLKSESDYYPWGGELQFANGDSNHYKFTGKERDSETGLDYFGARHYSSGLARFITPDWSSTPVPVPYADLTDPQSLNQYGYVRNLPTTRSDPDGHDGVWAFFRGVANAWASDNLMGAGRNDQGGVAYHLGQLIGDAGATLQGGVETLVSVAGEAAGGVLDATGVGLPAGVAVNTVSTIGLVHGSGTFATGANHLFRDKVEDSGGSSSAGTQESSADTVHGAQREAMRQEKIPTTQQPDKQGSTKAGRQYTYTVPRRGAEQKPRLSPVNTQIEIMGLTWRQADQRRMARLIPPDDNGTIAIRRK